MMETDQEDELPSNGNFETPKQVSLGIICSAAEIFQGNSSQDREDNEIVEKEDEEKLPNSEPTSSNNKDLKKRARSESDDEVEENLDKKLKTTFYSETEIHIDFNSLDVEMVISTKSLIEEEIDENEDLENESCEEEIPENKESFCANTEGESNHDEKISQNDYNESESRLFIVENEEIQESDTLVKRTENQSVTSTTEEESNHDEKISQNDCEESETQKNEGLLDKRTSSKNNIHKFENERPTIVLTEDHAIFGHDTKEEKNEILEDITEETEVIKEEIVIEDPSNEAETGKEETKETVEVEIVNDNNEKNTSSLLTSGEPAMVLIEDHDTKEEQNEIVEVITEEKEVIKEEIVIEDTSNEAEGGKEETKETVEVEVVNDNNEKNPISLLTSGEPAIVLTENHATFGYDTKEEKNEIVEDITEEKEVIKEEIVIEDTRNEAEQTGKEETKETVEVKKVNDNNEKNTTSLLTSGEPAIVLTEDHARFDHDTKEEKNEIVEDITEEKEVIKEEIVIGDTRNEPEAGKEEIKETGEDNNEKNTISLLTSGEPAIVLTEDHATFGHDTKEEKNEIVEEITEEKEVIKEEIVLGDTRNEAEAGKEDTKVTEEVNNEKNRTSLSTSGELSKTDGESLLLIEDSEGKDAENKKTVDGNVITSKPVYPSDYVQKSALNSRLVGEILKHRMAAYFENQSFKPYSLKPVKRETLEFRTVNDLFVLTSRTHRITRIDRVENPYLLGMYLLKKEKMERLNGIFQVEERSLFHGTMHHNIDGICRYNFDWRRRGQSRGHKFGQGVSFAPEVSYARHYSHGDRVMLLVKVLVSKVVEGNCDTVVPTAPYDTTRNYDGNVIVKFLLAIAWKSQYQQ